MIGISNSYQSDITVIAHAMGNVIGLLLKDTQEWCRLNDTYIEAFQLSKSVSNLAMNSPGANLNTRKFTEIGKSKLQYVAKANRWYLKKEETPSRGWKNAEKWALILINFHLICAIN